MMAVRLSPAASSATSCAALALPAASRVAAAVLQHTALLIVACQYARDKRGAAQYANTD